MDINGISQSSYVPPPTMTQGVQPSQVSGSDPDGDAGGRVGKSHGHGSHGHGHMQIAPMQAFQNLGLTLPTSQATGGTPAGDMHQFMHALFQAVKSEGTAATSASASTSTDPGANFASGLSALIAQVSNGSAPPDLQNAFSKVVADLQPAAASSGYSGSTSGGTSPQATLQALLTQLQQNLGYGASSSSAAIGNLLIDHA